MEPIVKENGSVEVTEQTDVVSVLISALATAAMKLCRNHSNAPALLRMDGIGWPYATPGLQASLMEPEISA